MHSAGSLEEYDICRLAGFRRESTRDSFSSLVDLLLLDQSETSTRPGCGTRNPHPMTEAEGNSSLVVPSCLHGRVQTLVPSGVSGVQAAAICWRA